MSLPICWRTSRTLPPLARLARASRLASRLSRGSRSRPTRAYDPRTVTIGRARVLDGGRAIVKAPKSENSWRTLPLDEVLARALQALHDRQVTEEMEAGTALRERGSGHFTDMEMALAR